MSGKVAQNMEMEVIREEQRERKIEEVFREQFQEDDDLFTEPVDPNAKLPGLEDKNKFDYPFFLNKIANMVNDGYAPVIAICGPPRVGKTETAEMIAHYLHDKVSLLKGSFEDNVTDHLTYDTLEFLNMIDVDLNSRDTDDMDVRKSIIVDDAGTVLNADNYHSDFNKSFDETLQTMGFLNNVYILVLQVFTDLDPRARKYVNVVLNVFDRQKVKATGLKQNYGRIRSDERKVRKVPLPPWTPERPPEKIRNAYDQKEKDYKIKNHKQNIQDVKQSRKEEKEERSGGMDWSEVL